MEELQLQSSLRPHGQPLLHPPRHALHDLPDLLLVPHVVPHVLVEEDLLVLGGRARLREELEGHGGVDQLVEPALHYHERRPVVLERARALVHGVDQHVRRGEVRPLLEGAGVLLHVLRDARVLAGQAVDRPGQPHVLGHHLLEHGGQSHHEVAHLVHQCRSHQHCAFEELGVAQREVVAGHAAHRQPHAEQRQARVLPPHQRRELRRVRQVLLQRGHLSWLAWRPSEPAVVEPHRHEALLSHPAGDVRAVADVGVEPVEHDDNCPRLLLGGVAIGGQLDEPALLALHHELDEILLGEYVVLLRVRLAVLVLLGLVNSLLALLF